MEMLRDSGEILHTRSSSRIFFTARFGEDGELNVIDDYLERRGWCESDSARRYLEALRDSTPSLYEVVDIDPGTSLTLRDLLVPGEEMTINESLGSEAAAPWDRLAARIVTVNGERVLTGAILAFPPDATDNLFSAFDRLVKEATKEYRKKFRPAARRDRRRRRKSAAVPPEIREEIIRSLPCAEIFTHFWIIDVLSRALAPLPELQNTDGEAMVFCEVRFPIAGDEKRISAVLDGIEGFERGRGRRSPLDVVRSPFPDEPADKGSRRRSARSDGERVRLNESRTGRNQGWHVDAAGELEATGRARRGVAFLPAGVISLGPP